MGGNCECELCGFYASRQTPDRLAAFVVVIISIGTCGVSKDAAHLAGHRERLTVKLPLQSVQGDACQLILFCESHLLQH